MTALDIITIDDTLVVSSEDIAAGTGSEHASILRTIDDNLSDFEDFGRVRFEIRPFATAGGIQSRRVALLTEPQATLLMTFMRNIGPVKEFKKALVKAFFEMARQLSKPVKLTRSDLARMVLASEAEKDQAIERAEVAETFRKGIETSDGLSVRAWHKHYLPDIPERRVFDLLYGRGLLIDQRGQRQDQFGRPKAGKQHGHPTYAGKAFFYLHAYVDPSTGDRHEHTRVRPGLPEVELAAWVSSRIARVA